MTPSPFITCIASGPLVEALNNGCVRVYDATNHPDAFAAAMRDNPNVVQCIAVDPAAGVKRDYRRASLKAVCDVLMGDGIEYRIAETHF